MYCLETLRSLNAAEVRKHYKAHPLKRVLVPEDCTHAPDYTGTSPEVVAEKTGSTFIEEYFVDSSGFGSPGEPALTLSRFYERVKALLRERKGEKIYAAITGAGQFQVYVSLFSKGGK